MLVLPEIQLVPDTRTSDFFTPEPLSRGHPFFTRYVAFLQGWPIVVGRNQYNCLDLYCPVALIEGLASGQGRLSKGVPPFCKFDGLTTIFIL